MIIFVIIALIALYIYLQPSAFRYDNFLYVAYTFNGKRRELIIKYRTNI